ncbi:MAG: Hsp20/alpha crystallin family protein [Rhodospirillaceae bacterium]
MPLAGHGFWPNLLDSLRQVGQRIADYFAPQADAAASEDAYHIDIELPGVDETDIDVSITDSILHVKGEKNFERREQNREYFFSERAYGAFHRSFRLPPDADDKSVSAEFHRGVLTLTVPKRAAEEPASQRIEIKPRG